MNQMFKKQFFTVLFLLGLLSHAFAQGDEDTAKALLFLGGTAHLGNGEVIENSAIGIEDGKIILVADATRIRIDGTKYRTRQINGKHVYPGLIAPATHLGLVDIAAVRASRDYYETGEMNPHVRAIIAYNTDSEVIPTIRSNGILTAQIIPKGSLISGSSSIVSLQAWNWEDAAMSSDRGIHLDWPSMYKRYQWKPGKEELQDNEAYEEEWDRLNAFFAQARAYCELEQPEEDNIRFEAMCGLFTGEKTLFVRANYVREIIAAVLFARSHDLKPVLVGGRDAWKVAGFLSEEEVPVILEKTHRLPAYPESALDQPFRAPAILHEAGVLFAIGVGSGWYDFYHQRNLPFEAGSAVAYGLSREEALRAISLNTAEILGIADRCGSLEVGKDATLIISSGDILDVRSHHIEAAYIQGEPVTLDNKQRQLYKTYMDKYSLPVPERYEE